MLTAIVTSHLFRRSPRPGLSASGALLTLAATLLFAQPVRSAETAAPPVVTGLRCEFMKTPLGIDDAQPALSWTIQDDRHGVMQTAYRVLVASSTALLAQGQGDLWDSGDVASDQSHLVVYAGKPLVSRERCFWKVQVRTAADGQTLTGGWSEPSWWEMGLLQPTDWQGSWIQSAACQPVDNDITRRWTRQTLVPQELNDSVIKGHPAFAPAARAEGERLMGSLLPAPVFRTTFAVTGTVKRARLYVSGLGFEEAFINGAPVSNRMFDPSVNYYQGRGGYVTHDITALVHAGDNVVAATVGAGWWYETIIWGSPDKYLGRPSLRAQVEVELTDGQTITVPTSASWTTAVGPILKNHYYAGEVYDARRAPGWKTGATDGLPWVAATEVPAPVPVLAAQRCEPERIIRRIQPVAVAQPRPGIWVFDLGQMVMGTVELNLKAPAGTVVVMRTAEWTWHPSQQGPNFSKSLSLLYYDAGDNTQRTEGMIVGKTRGGTFAGFNYRPKGVAGIRSVHLGVPTLVYVARGDAAGESWHPSFTTHPFRYVEVQGLPEAPTTNLLAGLMISNDEEVTGKFVSGSQRFNEIWEACMNSTRFTTHGMTWDNAVERLQSQVYNAWSAPFASYVLWYPNLWRKILEDERLGDVLEPPHQQFGTSIYGTRGGFSPPRMPVTQGVTVELPMAYYDRFGDRRELAEQYPHMKAWVEAFFPNHDGKITDQSSMNAWRDHFCQETCDDSDWSPEWDQKTMMSMMLYGDVRDTADIARVLGKGADAESLDRLAAAIRAEVNRTWYDATNKTYSAAKAKGGARAVDASTGWHGMMAMAIAQGVAPEADVPQLLDNCIADMKKHYHSHFAAGHITHQLVYDVFSDHGMIETCYDMMNATGFPSFTWMLQSGNRTVPEGPTWKDSLPAKASAYQNECQEPARWFTQTLCGVLPDRAEPGFKHVLLRPHIPSRLPSASLVTTTPYGELESSWTQQAGRVTWTVRIPANSYATAWIPTADAGAITESGRSLAGAPGCQIRGAGAAGVECRLGSGTFTFQFPAPVNEASRLGELK